MSDQEGLQSRFAAALRRELGMTDAGAPGASVVVAAPDVNITPRIVAELPALLEPLEVVDVQRFGGAFEWQVTPVRGPDGVMVSAKLTPTAFINFEVKP